MKFSVERNILFEDEVILVIHKPAGLMVEPDRNGNPSLLQEVKEYLKASLHSNNVYAQHIHRLDRPVSGIVLFTKDRSVLKNLSEQFAERKVSKFYYALTATTPAQQHGILEHWHRKEKKKAQLYDHEIAYSEKARLTFKIIASTSKGHLWDIELHTGRYHQIRAQLAHIGCPILGDTLYGSGQLYLPDSIALQAYKLVFAHPVNQHQVIIELPNTLI